MKAIVMGCGRAGAAIAQKLSDDGNEVTVIVADRRDAGRLPREMVENGQITIVVGDGSSSETLEALDIGSVEMFFAMSGKDTLNGLAAQKAKTIYRVGTVVASVEDSDLCEMYETRGIVTVNPTKLAADRIAIVLPAAKTAADAGADEG